MGLEVPTYVSDLVTTNPTSTDLRSQGDDHLRYLKLSLKNSFPNATKPFYFPTILSKSADYSVLSTDDKVTFICNTASAFTLTLPTLVSGDAGWSIEIIKSTTDANPVYITPPSGTINGFSKIRRSAENLITKVVWTGSVFVANRPNGGRIGDLQPNAGAALPNGTLLADGLTFTAANFVELNSVLGGNTKPDVSGRMIVGKESVATRITTAVSGVDGATQGAAGGNQIKAVSIIQLQPFTPTGVVSSDGRTIGWGGDSTGGTYGGASVGGEFPRHNQPITAPDGYTLTMNPLGSGTGVPIMPPIIVENMLVVAE